MAYKTNGEEKFAELLTERKLPFVYEQPYANKSKNPDFTLNFKNINIIAEVKDFDLNEEDEKIITEIEKNGNAGWIQDQPYKRIRRALHEKADQLKEYADYPTLVILYGSPQNLTINLSTENILEAIHADMITTIETDDFGETTATTSFDTRNAVIGPKRNIHMSAAAIIDTYRPNAELANKIVKAHQENGGDALTEKGQKELVILFSQEEAKGINFDLEVLRLRIFYNPSAKIPLDLGTLSSPYDIEIFYDQKEKKFKEYRNGEIQDYPFLMR